MNFVFEIKLSSDFEKVKISAYFEKIVLKFVVLSIALATQSTILRI